MLEGKGGTCPEGGGKKTRERRLLSLRGEITSRKKYWLEGRRLRQRQMRKVSKGGGTTWEKKKKKVKGKKC